MGRDKYHAELNFVHTGGAGSPEKIRFTAVDLERLMHRFTTEVAKREEENRQAQHYVYIKPNLTVEVCASWAEFDQYEHA
jgi:hypothetical protein